MYVLNERSPFTVFTSQTPLVNMEIVRLKWRYPFLINVTRVKKSSSLDILSSFRYFLLQVISQPVGFLREFQQVVEFPLIKSKTTVKFQETKRMLKKGLFYLCLSLL